MGQPVVANEVQRALQTSSFNFNGQELTTEIVFRVKPFIEKALKEEIQKVQQINPDELVDRIIIRLKPIVIKVIQTTVRAENVDLSNTRGLIQDGSLLNLITDEVRAALGPGSELPAKEEIIALLNSLRGDIRRIVIEEIGFFNNANNVSDADRRRVIEAILRLLRDQVVRATNQYLQGKNPTQVTDRQVVEAVSGNLRGQIVSIIQSELPNLDLNSDAFSNLMSGAMSQMRPIILETVQAWRQRLAAEAAAAAAAKPEPPKTDAVTSIFGSGGANNIKVKTQDFQFNTAWE